jgi:hypothetical protein
MSINASKYTAHTHLGKFEGETAATEYFYEQSLIGNGETLFAPTLDESQDEYWETGNSGEVFHINTDEAEAFNLLIGHWFLLREDSQGFVYGTTHATRVEAEKKFQDWIA